MYNESCRYHDIEKKDIDIGFFPIYTIMFMISVLLNSILLYVVIKKDKFINEKRSFHKLFQVLIFLDLIISILILPNILIKRFSKDTDTSILLDGYLGIRDYAISSQMIILVLIAIDRLLAFLLPLSNFWRIDRVFKGFKVFSILTGLFYLVRFIFLSIDYIDCDKQKLIDKYAKLFIGRFGAFLMVLSFFIYCVLFTLLCRRQIFHHKDSIISSRDFKSVKVTELDNKSHSEISKLRKYSGTLELKKESTLTKLKFIPTNRKIGSIKFVKILFLANLLMIISYLPAILYNLKWINFPSYSVYYLFFLHALGDPVLFFVTRREMLDSLLKLLHIK